MSDHQDPGLRELAAAYAMGALSPEEARAFEAELARSSELRAEVAEYRETFAVLGAGAPAPRPAPELRARVLARIAAERDVALPDRAAPARPVRTPLWLALAASLLLAVWLGASLYRSREDLASGEAARDSLSAALASVEARLAEREQTLDWILEPGVELNMLTTTGGAEPRIQFFVNRVSRVAMVHAFNMSPAGPGQVYQLWFIQDGKPVPSVTFNSESDGHALVQGIEVPAGGSISHAAVTVEPSGGSPAPTTPVILIGALRS